MSHLEVATFAGGCFWCMVKPFDQQPGIKKVVSGYTGGHVKNPTYEQVCSETTGHLEAVQITFDPAVYSYESLVRLYFTLIDELPGDISRISWRPSPFISIIIFSVLEDPKLYDNPRFALAPQLKEVD